MSKISKLFVLVAFFVIAALAVAGINYSPNVYATKDLFKEAKDMYGKDIKGCKHCHVKGLPKDDDHELNEVGKFLEKKKEEMKADHVDVSWLKEYKPMN